MNRVDAVSLPLVIGSSLTVFRGRRFVEHAVGQGEPVAVLDHGTARRDATATPTIDHGCSPVLCALADAHRV